MANEADRIKELEQRVTALEQTEADWESLLNKMSGRLKTLESQWQERFGKSLRSCPSCGRTQRNPESESCDYGCGRLDRLDAV